MCMVRVCTQVEGSERWSLASKLGTYRLAEISTSQLMVEIERASVQKQLDLLNKVMLFEAVLCTQASDVSKQVQLHH